MTDKQLAERLTKLQEAEAANDIWKDNTVNFLNEIERHGVENFLRFPTIYQTMFVGNVEYIDTEYRKLLADINWPLWNKAIQDSHIGNPIPYVYNINTTGNAIHAAYHLMILKQQLTCDLSKLDYIYEFGGGYGCMARTCKQAGFGGKYILHDLPLFLLLQQWYLEEHGLVAEYLPNHEALDVSQNSLFISTWALSEAPTVLRDKQVEMWRGFKYILIAYQQTFDKIDNRKYFLDAIKDIKEFSWQHIPLSHITSGTHRYLLGVNYYV
jgi:hypothetical protein